MSRRTSPWDLWEPPSDHPIRSDDDESEPGTPREINRSSMSMPPGVNRSPSDGSDARPDFEQSETAADVRRSRSSRQQGSERSTLRRANSALTVAKASSADVTDTPKQYCGHNPTER